MKPAQCSITSAIVWKTLLPGTHVLLLMTVLASCASPGSTTSSTPTPEAHARPAPSEDTQASCLDIVGKQDVIIENRQIGPCAGPGILIKNSRNITIKNVTITDTGGVGIRIINSRKVSVTNSSMSRGRSGVYAERSKDIYVAQNKFLNVQGPKPRGQYVQFNKVTGQSRITCNEGHNELGQSVPEDAISLYKSSGTREYPISIDHNLIVGGGPSRSGGGIMLGDQGGDWLIASNNIVLDPGQYGIAVAGGTNMTIKDNIVFGRQQEFTNVGIYVFNQSKNVCSSVSVIGNTVNWTSKKSRPNSWWNGNNCGTVDVKTSNRWNAKLDPNAIKSLPAYCSTTRAVNDF